MLCLRGCSTADPTKRAKRLLRSRRLAHAALCVVRAAISIGTLLGSVPVSILVVTGTGTGVGKTVVTAAVAALAVERGIRVAVAKPAQTGVGANEPGDLDDVRRLTTVADLHEFARLPDALFPAAAARRAAVPPLDQGEVAARVRALAADRDLVVVEGAEGLLVRYDDAGSTIAGLARLLDAEVLVVVDPSLGTLNHTALTLEALAHRDLRLSGVVIGAWPDNPDLACRSNIRDLRCPKRTPSGAMRAGAGVLKQYDE